MLRTERLLNKLAELGFKYCGENKVTKTFRNGTQRVYVRKRDTVSEGFAVAVLSQCGVSRADLREFIQQAKS